MNLPKKFCEACNRFAHTLTEHCLFINVAQQKLTHYNESQTVDLTISTSLEGTGQKEGSHKTPLGLHRIYEKIGDGEPEGTVFKGRRPIRFDGKGDPTALITDRILWLEGLEPGFNCGDDLDSRKRYIYIHGIGDESHLGRPNSKGCIHVGSKQLFRLYDAVPVGTLVYISEN